MITSRYGKMFPHLRYLGAGTFYNGWKLLLHVSICCAASDPATKASRQVNCIEVARSLLLRVHPFSSRLIQQKIAHALAFELQVWRSTPKSAARGGVPKHFRGPLYAGHSTLHLYAGQSTHGPLPTSGFRESSSDCGLLILAHRPPPAPRTTTTVSAVEEVNSKQKTEAEH